jgi:sphingolipid delta-4 desaturase
MQRCSFVESDTCEPHGIRTKQILTDCPSIRSLISKNPLSFWAIVGLTGAQFILAWLSVQWPWWVLLLAAYLIGAVLDHALFVMIHECSHRLLFRSHSANRFAGMLANTPLLFPSSVSFETYHLKHHAYQGIHELDGDLPNYWEARLINNFCIGKMIWLLFYPFFQLFRLFRLKEIRLSQKWVACNWIVQVLVVAAISYWWGSHAIIYLISSFFFSVGLHPLGARWIQEHYLTKGTQETYSYYGVMNLFAFNVGFHNEHHDFPSIPWNKLPQIREQAPAYYNELASHKSWTKLLFRFLFDREISLFSRVVRTRRSKGAA